MYVLFTRVTASVIICAPNYSLTNSVVARESFLYFTVQFAYVQ